MLLSSVFVRFYKSFNYNYLRKCDPSPVWEWIRHPATRWVFTSYAESLAGQHSQDRRTLLQSPWYCGHWGPRVSLTSPTEASEYWNAQRGRMLATSVGAAVTGKGGNRIVVDDPHTPLGAESAAQRHRVIEYFRRSVATRLDDKQRGAIVVVMQRLHAQDLTATCLDLGYTHLCLPAEATSRTTGIVKVNRLEPGRKAS